MVMYVTSFAANSPVSYFNINIFFLILLFIATVIVVRKIRPEFAYLVPVAPAMIASLFINWDLWAIATMMLAIYWFDRKQYLASAVLLGISISTKFLPIFLLIPIVFIFWRDSKMKEGDQIPCNHVWYLVCTQFTLRCNNSNRLVALL
jgi:uncharacterized membrane protein